MFCRTGITHEDFSCIFRCAILSFIKNIKDTHTQKKKMNFFIYFSLTTNFTIFCLWLKFFFYWFSNFCGGFLGPISEDCRFFPQILWFFFQILYFIFIYDQLVNFVIFFLYYALLFLFLVTDWGKSWVCFYDLLINFMIFFRRPIH